MAALRREGDDDEEEEGDGGGGGRQHVSCPAAGGLSFTFHHVSCI